MNYDLEYGDEGTDVRRLQEYLSGASGAALSPDGSFGSLTRAALREYQRVQGLDQSGKVDEPTFYALAGKGLVLLGLATSGSSSSLSWPNRPGSPTQPTAQHTVSLFGDFKFRHTPTATNAEHIDILDGWVEQNIVELHIPQLDKCMFAVGRRHVRRDRGTIHCHHLAAPAFLKLFERWEDAGLMDRILTCAGAFNARLKRGEREPKVANLSNHSWGTAIDLNAWENPRGQIPVGVGARGCLRELVEIANGLGFFWGGHFSKPPDGMHFELSVIA